MCSKWLRKRNKHDSINPQEPEVINIKSSSASLPEHFESIPGIKHIFENYPDITNKIVKDIDNLISIVNILNQSYKHNEMTSLDLEVANHIIIKLVSTKSIKLKRMRDMCSGRMVGVNPDNIIKSFSK